MRRASVVGPLILIAIGVLFLSRNLYPDLPLMDLLARYWPFLLIGWGILRLVEILFWAVTSKPLPRSGVSGGEWVLVVFLVLIGWTAYTAQVHSNWFRTNRINIGGLEMFGEAFDYPIAGEKASIGKTPQIVIESFRGNVRIAGADVENVKVAGRKTVPRAAAGGCRQGKYRHPVRDRHQRQPGDHPHQPGPRVEQFPRQRGPGDDGSQGRQRECRRPLWRFRHQ